MAHKVFRWFSGNSGFQKSDHEILKIASTSMAFTSCQSPL